MGVAYNTSVVLDGLVAYLDAANPKSYSGSGTTWNDISGNGNNGTLVNGPTYSSNFNGSFLLDELNDEITFGTVDWNTLGSTRNYTMMFGAKKIAYGTGGNNTGNSYLFQGASNGYNTGWRILEASSGTPGAAFTGAQSYSFGSPAISTVVQVTDTVANRFAICAFSQNSTNAFAFLNGVSSTATFGSYASGTTTGFIGRATDGVGRFNGYISFLMVYNRALTPAEISLNFNAMRGRYGI